MAFNFSNLGDTKGVATVQRRLKPWDIHEVEFKGASIQTIEGKKNPGTIYQILKVRFENKDGYYEESIFFPKDGDEKRPTRKNKDGNDVEMPSTLERTEAFIAQVSAVLNPEQFKKLQEHAKAGKFKDFDTVAKYFIEKICKPVEGTKTHLKLIGKVDKDGNVQTILPYFVALNKEGNVFISDNFIGDKLFFSDYEERQRKAFETARPTKMKADPNLDIETSSTEVEDTSDLDQVTKDELDSMLDGLD